MVLLFVLEPILYLTACLSPTNLSQCNKVWWASSTSCQQYGLSSTIWCFEPLQGALQNIDGWQTPEQLTPPCFHLNQHLLSRNQLAGPYSLAVSTPTLSSQLVSVLQFFSNILCENINISSYNVKKSIDGIQFSILFCWMIQSLRTYAYIVLLITFSYLYF